MQTKCSSPVPKFRFVTIEHQKKLVRDIKPRQKMRFNHQERIDFIYLVKVHGIGPKEIARQQNLNYTTIYTILKEYCDFGRTNRQLIYQEKINRLNLRLDKQISMIKRCQEKGIAFGSNDPANNMRTWNCKRLTSIGRFGNRFDFE